ncbi:uncharacterized protein LOC128883535 [Hylaeus volcanicus]|uniref:uncharacterized protein LOC128883535 n=1 Tax=Hylaeus volcanicus TaxID=313075 RepID=UPI0023B833AA|nr:uncharacterized protein LOC128883535 [Hylaeus volcanicus]
MGEKRSSKPLNPACAYARGERERQRKKNLLKKKNRRESSTCADSVQQTSCATWMSSKCQTVSETPDEKNVIDKDKDSGVRLNAIRLQYRPTVVTKNNRVILPSIQVKIKDDDSDTYQDTEDTEESCNSTTNDSDDAKSVNVKQNVISSLKEQVVSRMNIIKAQKDIFPPSDTAVQPPEEEDEDISPEVAARLEVLCQIEKKNISVKNQIPNNSHSSVSVYKTLNNQSSPTSHSSTSLINEYQCKMNNTLLCQSTTFPNDCTVLNKTLIDSKLETVPNSACIKSSKNTLFVPTSLRLQNKPKTVPKIINGKPFRFGTGASLAESAKSVNKAMVSSSFSKPILTKHTQVENSPNLETAFQNFMNDITKSLE